MPQNRISVKPMNDLEQMLGYQFKNRDLLLQALTHASAISEDHPEASNREQSSLAFVGDSALKYAVARYLYLNGRDDVVKNRDILHNGTQTIVPNSVLAEIARNKLHLEKYVIRGNAHKDLSTKMYATCLEAIFGAIALDCPANQQEVIFTVVEKLCSDRYETLLKPIETVRFKSAYDEDEDLINVTRLFFNICLSPLGIAPPQIIYKSPNKTFQQKLGQAVLWFFAILGFVMIVWKIIEFIQPSLPFNFETQRQEF
ncbi:unnamed protein product [Adineta steineri]|uniref:RNase III domain-containing protein n=1 Tax=Adineta steineri TaxID=433720 RepID=A0A814S8W5_9BILA|nr:unnamed protein product [Adineta steineri]CAF1434613.1 unnamed protein product [Adineta steineri]CAF1443603.1 unnamed protein product [Adineta steineri]CAF3535571.1 unnamed protein product [Adineta steineri]CAF3704211.1 unnamed protein product [Adineta steineri]